MNILKNLKSFKKFIPEFVFLISFALSIYSLDLNWFNTHMARDVYRAQHWNWLGPEIGWDYKRLPGPLYYWLLGLLSLTKSLYFILICKIIAIYLALLCLMKEIQKSFHKDVLNYFLILFLLMPVYIFTSRNLWNPSLIILFNSLQFLFILKFKNSQSKKWIYFSALTAFIGLQVHFSTVIAHIAFGLSVILLNNIEKSFKKLQSIIFLLFFGWLTAWYFVNYIPEFNSQISNFYGANSYLLNRLSDLSYNLTLNLVELRDYDLFSLYFRTLSELNLINASLLLSVSTASSIAYTLLFIYSLYLITIQFIKKRSLLDLYLILHTFLFLVSIFIFKSKEHIPYRYGLALYPIQFFLISYGLYISLNTKRTYLAFKFLSIITFMFYMYFNIKIIQAQGITGRAHHTNNDNLELTLKNKQYIYNFLNKNVHLDGDPFNYLHGRTANKFRLKEMNWQQSIPYFSLYNMTTGKKFTYNEKLKEDSVQENWLVQLKNLQQLKLDSTNALSLTELSSEVFPENLKIIYLDANKKIVKIVNWKNSSLILPLAFATDLNRVDFIRLQFEMDTTTYKYINVLIDDNDTYNFAYQNNYELLKFKTNNISLKPIKTYYGYFLVQNQHIFETPRNKRLQIDMELNLKTKFNNYSRIDIFSTESMMPEEELFPQTK